MDSMKRELEEAFESLVITKRQKGPTVEDCFEIGQIPYKASYSYAEVVDLINARESMLKRKFSHFMSLLKHSSYLKNMKFESANKVLKWIQ